MTQKKHEARTQLRDVSNSLCREVWDGKWDHLPEVHTSPIAEHLKLLEELERRCPGHSLEDYRDAYCRAMCNNR